MSNIVDSPIYFRIDVCSADTIGMVYLVSIIAEFIFKISNHTAGIISL